MLTHTQGVALGYLGLSHDAALRLRHLRHRASVGFNSSVITPPIGLALMACSRFARSVKRRGLLSGPFRADEYRWAANPGRCPGLSHVAALRLKSPAITQTLGLALMACSSFADSLKHRGLLSGPFRADEYRWAANPGRCPGLSHDAALRLRHLRHRASVGFKSPVITQPLGLALMACFSFTDSANRRGVLSGPFRADEYRWVAKPRRCPGLLPLAALGSTVAATRQDGIAQGCTLGWLVNNIPSPEGAQ